MGKIQVGSDGVKVKIVGPGDETFDMKYFGYVGQIVELDFEHQCGNIKILDGVNFTDPFIKIRFDLGDQVKYEWFWLEEIELYEEIILA